MMALNENIPTGRRPVVGSELNAGTIIGRKLSPIEELHRVEATVLSMGESPLQVELLDTLIARYGEALYATAGVAYTHGGDDAE